MSPIPEDFARFMREMVLLQNFWLNVFNTSPIEALKFVYSPSSNFYILAMINDDPLHFDTIGVEWPKSFKLKRWLNDIQFGFSRIFTCNEVKRIQFQVKAASLEAL